MDEIQSYIKFTDLKIGYQSGKKKRIVAENLDAMAGKGELICLLGANGTGKSTLLRSICGFQPFISGQIKLMEKPVNQLEEKDIARLLSVVLTERISVANASVLELVSYGRSPYTRLLGRLNERDKKIIEYSINQCGIRHKKNDLVSSLSDGERQKAFIAKALAQDTPIILLDEPTAFLDLAARIEIIRLLRKVASESGKSVVLSTHDLDLALQMADKLWLLQPGGPLITGSPEDLLIQNAFQRLFESKGIIFDTKTGLFRVDYNYTTELAVKGHGFEYVLLRRAFARNGIKITPLKEESDFWIEIEKNSHPVFKFYKENSLINSEVSVEKIVDTVMNHVKGLYGRTQ